MDYQIKQIVKVTPADWRKTTSFLGKIRELTQSGMYVSRMLGKRNASITETYYGAEEVSKL